MQLMKYSLVVNAWFLFFFKSPGNFHVMLTWEIYTGLDLFKYNKNPIFKLQKSFKKVMVDKIMLKKDC